MLSKNQTKFITNLQKKKYRNEQQLFLVEGVKVVEEFLLSTIELDTLFCTAAVEDTYKEYNPTLLTEKELSKISSLSTPNKVLAIFKIPTLTKINSKGLIVALDGINDPGNLGTIIRLCEWFGVSQLLCSQHTVDCYNTKVVQASMGSLARLSIQYVNLETVLSNTTLPIYGAVMDGTSINTKKLAQNGILIMGSESHGISSAIAKFVQHKITIAKFGITTVTDSLNVATATAIVLHEFRRDS